MNRIILFWLLVLSPFLLMVLVNEISNTPNTEYREDLCTRYCHSVRCAHALEKFKNSTHPFVRKAETFYSTTIVWLKDSGIGFNYREMNLAVYVGIFPLIMGLLLWGAIRKKEVKND